MKINFDREKFEQLARYFHDACNVNLFFHDVSGEVCYEPKSKCEICDQLRKIPQLDAKCHKGTLDAQKKCLETRKLQVYQCHMGFTEVMLPIFIDNICVGDLVFGQIINSDSTMSAQSIQRILEESFKLYHFEIENLSEKIANSAKMNTRSINSIGALMTICASHLIISEIVKLETLTTPILIEDYINKNLKEPIQSEDICRELNISRSQLYLISKENFNCGISKYIQNKRLEKAKVLLTTTSDEISHIAEEIGIIDNAYFSRFFKQATGLSPRDYRQAYASL